MSKSDLRIDILGTDFTISTDEESEYLDKLLSKYRRTIESVQQKTGLTDNLKIAVLTGFLLCDDLEKAGSAPESVKNEDQGEAERLALGMISRLDELVLDTNFTTDTELHGDTNSKNFTTEEHGEEELIKNNNFSSAPLRSLREEFSNNVTPCDSSPPSSPCPPSPPCLRVNIFANEIYKLQNAVKNYDWGSSEWIPALLGQKNISRIPWAELWMGVHPAGPSCVIENGDEPAPLLSELIEQDKAAFLGEEIAEKYGKLPFLFKVLAAAKPLSIQVHPSREQAVEGFDRENRNGIPVIAPNRNYRDSNHKPEIICALVPFTALCGFRNAQDISFLIQILCQDAKGALKASLEGLVSALEQEDENQYRAFIATLFGMEKETVNSLDILLEERQGQLEADFPEYKDEWGLCVYLSSLFPGDPGVLAPLYLNIVELAKGEAMFIPAGVLHSYIYGLGMELMTDSDNVLRGALTSKHVDKEELLKVIKFSPYSPEIISAPSPAPPLFSYPTPSEEFVLSSIHCGTSPIPYQAKGPSILFLTTGSADVTDGGTPLISLMTGESVFIPAGKNLELSGIFTAYSAAARVSKGETTAG